MTIAQGRSPHVVADLPSLVQRYLERNVHPDALPQQSVHFSQVGDMQLRPGRWSSFHADQEMAVDRVEFAWHAAFRLMPFVSFQVCDWYRAGGAGLDVRLWGLLRVVHARGLEIARGEAIRYLVELPLAPQAMAFNKALDWRSVDSSTVEVTTYVHDERVTALLHFDSSGDIIAASSPARPRLVGKKEEVDTPFRGVYGEYREFAGVRLPTTAEVSWLLPDGPFTYFRCQITEWSAESEAPLPRRAWEHGPFGSASARLAND
jgi:hypothetical protein